MTMIPARSWLYAVLLVTLAFEVGADFRCPASDTDTDTEVFQQQTPVEIEKSEEELEEEEEPDCE